MNLQEILPRYKEDGWAKWLSQPSWCTVNDNVHKLKAGSV